MIKNYKKFMESRSSSMWDIIPNSVKEIHQIFKSNGKNLFVVGGAVRDFLRNETPKDFDLCTDALPDEILSILEGKFKTNLQGKAFGVIVVYTHDQPDGMEIATFRSDTYDGKTRNPKVEYTTIDNDVLRRDIAINGLFYDLSKNEIIDLVGGVSDMENKIIRMIGDSKKRIEEDPLRILRSVRFSHRYGFEIEKDTFNSILQNGHLLGMITKERIWEEIKKSYSYKKDFTHYLELISSLDLWGDIFPDVLINEEFIQCSSLTLYMANLFKENNRDVSNIMISKFKIESDVSDKVKFLLALKDLTISNSLEMVKMKNRYHVDDDMALEWMKINKMEEKIHKAFIGYIPSTSSQELISLGFEGRKLGEEIKRREEIEFKKLIDSI